ncbi:MAG: hypothetical protein R3282_09780 [Rhodothermales bacterium]|nr:hypothetical protein [Rhodothermales bacterium]
MKAVLRQFYIAILALACVGAAQGQSLDRESHKVTISRAPETNLTIPARVTPLRLDAIDRTDVVRVKSNVKRLKLVLSVMEPVEIQESRSLPESTSAPGYREVFSTQSSLEPALSETVPLADLAREIPREVVHKKVEGRRLVVTVTE